MAVIDTAIYTLNIVLPEDMEALVTRLRTRLAGQEGPPVTLEHWPAALRFTADEWRPTLVERVNAALDEELGAGERERRFKPF